MGRRERRAARGDQLDPGYVALVERLARLIPEWVESREALPDLKFWDHDKTIVAAAVEPLTHELLARTPDAVDLLEYLREREPGCTIFQVRMALQHLGFMEGAEVLSHHQIQARMVGKAPTLLTERGKPAGRPN